MFKPSRVTGLAILAAITALLAVVVVELVVSGSRPPDRAYALEQQLRCPVCKSVSIAESPSETATAMRQQVTEQIAAGHSDEEIVNYFRARYGDWVLLDPPVGGVTAALWLIPAGALVIGLAVLLGRRSDGGPSPELSTEERARVAAALLSAAAIADTGQDET